MPRTPAPRAEGFLPKLCSFSVLRRVPHGPHYCDFSLFSLFLLGIYSEPGSPSPQKSYAFG
jgi:hypothetical protein